MIAAIYVRKSNDENGIVDEAKSVVRQEELARAFALKQGWTVRDVHSDDGVSGAEWGKKRPGLHALLAAAERGVFGIVVVSERKSIGREAVETAMTIKQLAKLGVEVWSYMDQKSLTPKNAMDKVMGALTGFKDGAHREDTSRRNHEAAARAHSMGRVCGGGVYG